MTQTVFFPYSKSWLDPSQIEKGNPDFTDFLSWLIGNVGNENYKIKFVDSLGNATVVPSNGSGWLITFENPKHAMLFKLAWI